MKILILGLFPVLVFWFVEDKFGTFWGLIAAMVWAVGECGYEFAKYRRVDKLTLFSTGLVVLLGGIGAWLDNSILFKFQPVIVELVFAAIIYIGGRGGIPVMLKMAQKTKPEVFHNQSPEVLERQKKIMHILSNHLIFVLIGHSLLLSYFALKGTTGQWAFWKGIGFNVFLGIWAVTEFGTLRLKIKLESQKTQTVKKAPPSDSLS
jgi:hypothetical protein